jgi:hypothetical protein
MDRTINIHPLRVPVLYKDAGFSADGLQCGDNTPGDVVGPFESLIIGIEDQDIFLLLNPRFG